MIGSPRANTVGVASSYDAEHFSTAPTVRNHQPEGPGMKSIWQMWVGVVLSVLMWHGSTLSQTTSASQPVCPSDYAFVEGLCRGAPSVCPAGTVLKGGVCSGMPGCPVGAAVEGGLCTRLPGCAQGFSYNSRQAVCTSTPVCGPDAKFDAELGRCVSPAHCLPSIAGRRCSCQSGGDYREQGQVCVHGVPACPAGARFDPVAKACQ